MRQLFHCLQWYAGSERVKGLLRHDIYQTISMPPVPGKYIIIEIRGCLIEVASLGHPLLCLNLFVCMIKPRFLSLQDPTLFSSFIQITLGTYSASCLPLAPLGGRLCNEDVPLWGRLEGCSGNTPLWGRLNGCRGLTPLWGRLRGIRGCNALRLDGRLTPPDVSTFTGISVRGYFWNIKIFNTYLSSEVWITR